MDYQQFIGGSYESQAWTADQERTINWYPEMLQAPGATRKAVLYPTPGVDALSFVSAGGVGRAHTFTEGREFLVIGNQFLEADSGGTLTLRGTVALNDQPATISSNGDGGRQLFITSGGNGYCYDLETDTLEQIAALDGRATMGDFIDGYFCCLDSSTSTLYLSNLFDGLTWNTGNQFAQRSLAPDRWVAMRVVQRFIWLMGTQTSEVWYDTGTDFPFAPHPSGLIQYGIAAPWSIGVIGTWIVWLAATVTGRVVAVLADGFTPTVISHYPFEYAAQRYKRLSEGVAFTYSDAGHTHWVCSFDEERVTWAWDAETKLWHERLSWHPDTRSWAAWRPRFYARAFNQHRILDASGPYLYRMGADLTGDVDGLAIRRVRRAPAIVDENKRVFYSSLEIDLDPGIGMQEIPPDTEEPIQWTDLVNASADGGTLTHDDTGDAGGGDSVQQLGTLGGWTEFTIDQEAGVENTYEKAFGLISSPPAGAGLNTDIEFGFYVSDSDNLYVQEGFFQPYPAGPTTQVSIGDTLRIAVSAAGVVTYWLNGGLFYTSASTATLPMYVMGWFGGNFAEITDAKLWQPSAETPKYDPVVMLRISNDGGKTWLPEQMRSAGRTGEYGHRVRWNRLGHGRRRVFEVSVSDPTPWRLVGAYLELAGQNPRARGGGGGR